MIYVLFEGGKIRASPSWEEAKEKLREDTPVCYPCETIEEAEDLKKELGW